MAVQDKHSALTSHFRQAYSCACQQHFREETELQPPLLAGSAACSISSPYICCLPTSTSPPPSSGCHSHLSFCSQGPSQHSRPSRLWMTARTLKLFLRQKQGLTWTQADKEVSCSCSKHCCSTWERTAGGHLNRRSVSKTSAWGKAVGGTRQSVLWIGK